jgi:5-methylcytosine-specific restriction endonuclease McrA
MNFDKIEWQRNKRNEFKKQFGYSQTAYFATQGKREDVLKRDNYKCVKCGMTDRQHKEKWNKPITIDHIDKNRRNNKMNNLQTLCLKCHGSKDISKELTIPKVFYKKDEILKLRNDGFTFSQIAYKTGFSIAAIWKWIKIWNTETIL